LPDNYRCARANFGALNGDGLCMADQHTGAQWKSSLNVATVKRGFVWEIDPDAAWREQAV
jgi:hypothetical protein